MRVEDVVCARAPLLVDAREGPELPVPVVVQTLREQNRAEGVQDVAEDFGREVEGCVRLDSDAARGQNKLQKSTRGRTYVLGGT